MARVPDREPVYKKMREFMDRCLIADRCLLWPDRAIWTPANLQEMRQRMIEQAIGGSSTFDVKLRQQMVEASQDLWAMLADMYYVYFLPSTHFTLAKRQKEIEWVIEQGRLPSLPPAVWDAQEHGFTRTSQLYAARYRQLWLLILLAERVKNNADRGALLNTPAAFQQTLDAILQSISNKADRATDLRHAMLHMAYPDDYERIISGRDKQRIIETFQSQARRPLPDDVDQALKVIRESVAESYSPRVDEFDFYAPQVKPLWRSDSAPPEVETGTPEAVPLSDMRLEDSSLKAVLAALSHTGNVILYGPPGTGKTYIARQVAQALIEPQLQEASPEPIRFLRAIEDLAWHEVVALSMYLAGPRKSHAVPDIRQQGLVAARFSTVSVKHESNQLWRVLQEHTPPGSQTVNYTDRRAPFLFDKDTQSRWTLTDEGREYVEQNLASPLELLKPTRSPAARPEEYLFWVTFHQAYSYEDFVEGIRPRTADDGVLEYPVVPGIFKRAAQRAAADPARKYVLVIDEINRGNIAKVFGELITLVEDDKRGSLRATLPYSGDEFAVPPNLVILGTMNTADRSIALLDVALRRRFAFVELMPRYDLLGASAVDNGEDHVQLATLLAALNRKIVEDVGRDFQLGHSYFREVARADDGQRLAKLEHVWNHRIRPLLYEYYYGQPAKLKELLRPFADGGVGGSEEAGTDLGVAYGDALLSALSDLTGPTE